MNKIKTDPFAPKPVIQGNNPKSLPSPIKTEEIKTKSRGRPKTKNNPNDLPDGWVRKTIIVQEKWPERIEDFAHFGNLTIRETYDKIFSEYFENRKHEPRPKPKNWRSEK